MLNVLKYKLYFIFDKYNGQSINRLREYLNDIRPDEKINVSKYLIYLELVSEIFSDEDYSMVMKYSYDINSLYYHDIP